MTSKLREENGISKKHSIHKEDSKERKEIEPVESTG